MIRVVFHTVSDFFRRWFHKRNIIIVSERKVKHIPISGHLQFLAFLLLLGGVCWASYSTGSFIAARTALKEQGQALRSVTNAHIESSFNTVFNAPTAKAKEAVDVGPYKRSALNVTTDGPMAALSVLDKAKLVARISLLESKVIELKNTNEEIVQRVHDKTAGKLDDLENIVKHTGLNLNELKKNYSYGKARRPALPSEGGPYIAADNVMLSQQAREMFSSLDDLAMINQIVNNLPLSSPMKNADEQSTFGHRVDPFNGHLAFHSGLDLAGPGGSRIYSTANGKVVSAGRNGAYGNAVDVDHGFSVLTRYAHMSEILVREGQTVKKGDVIGVQGSSGRSTGPHLHYEVRYHDQPMNPRNFLEAGRHVSQE